MLLKIIRRKVLCIIIIYINYQATTTSRICTLTDMLELLYQLLYDQPLHLIHVMESRH